MDGLKFEGGSDEWPEPQNQGTLDFLVDVSKYIHSM